MAAPDWLLEVAKRKRRPKADDATPPLRPGTYYRSPMYKQSHTVGPESHEDSLCGRPLWVDASWYQDNWEEAIGPFWLVVENRQPKGNQCGFCAQKLKALVADGRIRPDIKRPTRRQELTWRQQDMIWNGKLAWLRRELGAKEI